MEKMGNVRIYDRGKRTVDDIKYLNGEVKMFNLNYVFTVFINPGSIDVRMFEPGFMNNSINFKVVPDVDGKQYVGEYIDKGMILRLNFHPNKFMIDANSPAYLGEINFIGKVEDSKDEEDESIYAKAKSMKTTMENIEKMKAEKLKVKIDEQESLGKKLPYFKSVEELRAGYYLIDGRYKISYNRKRVGKLTKVYMNNLKQEIKDRMQGVIDQNRKDKIIKKLTDEYMILHERSVELASIMRMKAKEIEAIENGEDDGMRFDV